MQRPEVTTTGVGETGIEEHISPEVSHEDPDPLLPTDASYAALVETLATAKAIATSSNNAQQDSLYFFSASPKN